MIIADISLRVPALIHFKERSSTMKTLKKARADLKKALAKKAKTMEQLEADDF